MISEHTQPEEQPASPAVSKRQVVAAIADRIRRYNSDIDPASETFRAAVILLAAAEFGQNIDVIARCTGFDRSFVARCARRLIDNGVWVGGQTVADWSTADEASGTFWNDVAVAEGKMCRRNSSGTVEWAPAGFWNKGFHFNDAEAARRSDTLYVDALPAEPAAPAAPEVIGEGQAIDMIGSTDPSASLAHDESADENGAGPGTAPMINGKQPVPPLKDMFPDVIWIG